MTARMAVPYGPWVETRLSPQRFATYLRMAGHDRSRALALYEWSTSLNAALLHDFAHLEVGLRNMYDNALRGAVLPSNNHWLDNKSGREITRRIRGHAKYISPQLAEHIDLTRPEFASELARALA